MSKDAVAPPAPLLTNCAFTAVLLAGGKSSRMGRDKAGVLIGNQPLWQCQLSTLRALHPTELFISGKPDGPYASSGLEIIPDLTPGCGPLSGLEASLHRASHPLVLVLAIDLPAMTSEFLARLLHSVSTNHAHERGCVPIIDEWFEPLAAVYPKRALLLARACLSGADFSMQSFVRQALASDLLRPWRLTPEDAHLFRNLNTPADLAGDESL